MHYSNLVIIEKSSTNVFTQKTIEESVEKAMRNGEGVWWDWWQIGGRWTGLFDDYDPNKDPEKQEICEICNGTGTRMNWPDDITEEWKKECNGCNGCQGKGKLTSWPSNWGFRTGDVILIENLTQEHLDNVFRVVNPWGLIFGGEDYLPWAKDSEGKPDYEKMFPRKEKPPLEWLKKEYANHLGIIVDNHN